MLSQILPTLCSYLGKAGLLQKQQKLFLLLLLLSTGLASTYAEISTLALEEDTIITPSFLTYLKWHIYVSGVFCLMFVVFENIKITIQIIIRMGLVLIFYTGLLFFTYCFNLIVTNLTEPTDKIIAVFFIGWIAEIISFVALHIYASIGIAITCLISYWIINHNISYNTNHKNGDDSQNFEFGSQRDKRLPRKSKHNSKGVLHQFLLRMCSIMGIAELDLKQQHILILLLFLNAISSVIVGHWSLKEVLLGLGFIEFIGFTILIYIINLYVFIFSSCVCGLVFVAIVKIKITTRVILLFLRAIGAFVIKIITPLTILYEITKYSISHIEATEGISWFLSEIVNTEIVYIVVFFLLGYWGVKALYLDETTEEN